MSAEGHTATPGSIHRLWMMGGGYRSRSSDSMMSGYGSGNGGVNWGEVAALTLGALILLALIILVLQLRARAA